MRRFPRRRAEVIALTLASTAVAAASASGAPPRISLVTAPAAATAEERVSVVVSVARMPAHARVVVWIRRGAGTRKFGATRIAAGRFRARVVFPAAGRWALGARVAGISRRLRNVMVAPSFHVREPFRVVVAPDGGLLVADGAAHRILRVDAATGATTSFAGNGSTAAPVPGSGARRSSVGRPLDVAVEPDGSFAFVSDEKLWRIDGTTFAISRLARDAALAGPTAVAFDAAGDLFVAEYGGYASTGRVTRLSR